MSNINENQEVLENGEQLIVIVEGTYRFEELQNFSYLDTDITTERMQVVNSSLNVLVSQQKGRREKH